MKFLTGSIVQMSITSTAEIILFGKPVRKQNDSSNKILVK
jgi:hypothetical protein